MLGSIGAPELLLILLIVVIIFGGKKLPELGKSIGEGIKNFKNSMNLHEEEKDKSDQKPELPAK